MRWRLFAVFLLTFFVTAKGYLQVSDTSPSLETAESIVTRHALDIPYEAGYTWSGPDGLAYSKYGFGLVVVLIPEVAAAHVFASLAHVPERELAGFFISFLNIPSALLLLVTFAGILRRLGARESNVTLLTIALGLGTLVWHYAVSDFSEELQGALLLLAFDGVIRNTTRAIAWGGAAFAALVFVKVSNVLFLPALALYLLIRPGGPYAWRVRNATIFVAPAIPALVALAVLNYVRFRDPFESGYGPDAMRFSAGRLIHTVPALVGSLDKGMLIFSPVLVLGVLGWREFFRQRPHETLLCAALAMIDLLLKGSYFGWTGGWAWGPRMLVATLAFWLLPAGLWLEKPGATRRFEFAAVLTAISVVAQIPGIFVKDQELKAIRYSQLTAEERQHMRSDPSVAWFLLVHKLKGLDEIYSVSDFGAPGDRAIDFTPYRTYHGLNVWPAMAAERLHKPPLRWLTPLGLLAAAMLLASALRRLRAEASQPGHGAPTTAARHETLDPER